MLLCTWFMLSMSCSSAFCLVQYVTYVLLIFGLPTSFLLYVGLLRVGSHSASKEAVHASHKEPREGKENLERRAR